MALFRFVNSLAPYSKAVVAAGAALGVIGAALADGTISSAEGASIIAAVGGVLAVFGVRNSPKL